MLAEVETAARTLVKVARPWLVMVDQVLQPLTSFDSTIRRLLVTVVTDIASATASTRAQPSPTVKHAPPGHAGY